MRAAVLPSHSGGGAFFARAGGTASAPMSASVMSLLVPCVMVIGRSVEGLPIGVQIVGPWLEDRTPLKLAALIERQFGGFVAPADYR